MRSEMKLELNNEVILINRKVIEANSKVSPHLCIFPARSKYSSTKLAVFLQEAP